jgi:putative transposase
MSEFRKTYPGGVYFATITVVGWIDVFTRREYAEDFLEQIVHCQEKKGLEVYAYCLMSNHLHIIASLKTEKLSTFLGKLKSYSSKRLLRLIEDNPQESRKEWMMHLFKFYANNKSTNGEYHFWQNTNYPDEITSYEMLLQKIDYIHTNPVKAGLVNEPYEYRYSSAHALSMVKVLAI